jgi:hypothetical protein
MSSTPEDKPLVPPYGSHEAAPNRYFNAAKELYNITELTLIPFEDQVIGVIFPLSTDNPHREPLVKNAPAARWFLVYDRELFAIITVSPMQQRDEMKYILGTPSRPEQEDVIQFVTGLVQLHKTGDTRITPEVFRAVKEVADALFRDEEDKDVDNVTSANNKLDATRRNHKRVQDAIL